MTPRAAGPSERPGVLVIPGIDGDSSLLRQAGPLLFPDRAVYYFDHRTDAAAGGVAGMAERALRSIGAQEQSTIVCGESFGSTVALCLALDHPGRVAGLILFSPFARYPNGLVRRFAPLGLRMWDVVGNAAARAAFALWRPVSLLGAMSFVSTPRLALAYLRRTLPDAAAYRRKAELSMQFDARPFLPSIRCPALIVAGATDFIVSSSASQELHRLLPGSRLVRLEGRHLAHIVQPVQISRIINDWLLDNGIG
jgi:pimeloyl-ACP methyl ester carboxylesterase